ncbi:protein of unknown function [Kyrpidia spormannii]|uniref:Uncharacterized protein n=2 Tax=Kyrpidia spormannii TaxID=2055160 RepID=A0ACA8ZDX1_9BACL|nr:protein of unknown function [Kyrpidia spormannii]CAB3395960.1 protein of unknown function [Kyrpidia spormannii]
MAVDAAYPNFLDSPPFGPRHYRTLFLFVSSGLALRMMFAFVNRWGMSPSLAVSITSR